MSANISKDKNHEDKLVKSDMISTTKFEGITSDCIRIDDCPYKPKKLR